MERWKAEMGRVEERRVEERREKSRREKEKESEERRACSTPKCTSDIIKTYRTPSLSMGQCFAGAIFPSFLWPFRALHRRRQRTAWWWGRPTNPVTMVAWGRDLIGSSGNGLWRCRFGKCYGCESCSRMQAQTCKIQMLRFDKIQIEETLAVSIDWSNVAPE